MQNEVMQTLLFDSIDVETGAKDTGDNGTGFKDPAFASNKRVPVHRWVPWIAGFSREFVQDALGKYLPTEGMVLDPFSGVGTTLVEAVLAGNDAIGFEINPYAALACQTKLNAYKLEDSALGNSVKDFQSFYDKAMASDYKVYSKPPAGFKTRGEFYSPKILRKVLIVHDFISAIKDNSVRDFFKVAFGSTMVTYSNYSYEPSLGRRITAGKEEVEDFPVGEAIVQKLLEMVCDIRWMKEQLNGVEPQSHVFNASFFEYEKYVHPGSVDLIVTSPPYLNNYHYNRNTRPHLYWLGFAETPPDLKPLEEHNFGKFWQTVRDKNCVDIDSRIDDAEIVACLRELRSKNPEKGIYGGNGWANYAASYFNDCYKFAKAVRYVLKKKGIALVVIGNSILQGVMIPTDRFLGKIAEIAGLELVSIHIPRATRIGSSIIQSAVRSAKAKDSHQLYEAVVELRRR